MKKFFIVGFFRGLMGIFLLTFAQACPHKRCEGMVTTVLPSSSDAPSVEFCAKDPSACRKWCLEHPHNVCPVQLREDEEKNDNIRE